MIQNYRVKKVTQDYDLNIVDDFSKIKIVKHNGYRVTPQIQQLSAFNLTPIYYPL